MTFQEEILISLSEFPHLLWRIMDLPANNPIGKLLLAWNIAGMVLLLNIVINAILSVPGPLQQFGFERPNIAVVQYPYSWLPTFIVPVVLFSHLAAIRQLTIWRN